MCTVTGLLNVLSSLWLVCLFLSEKWSCSLCKDIRHAMGQFLEHSGNLFDAAMTWELHPGSSLFPCKRWYLQFCVRIHGSAPVPGPKARSGPLSLLAGQIGLGEFIVVWGQGLLEDYNCWKGPTHPLLSRAFTVLVRHKLIIFWSNPGPTLMK